MPEETQREVFDIVVQGQQAQDTLNKILEAVKKIEQGMTNLGGQIDKSVGRLTTAITGLNKSVVALNQNLAAMQANLGNVTGLQSQGQAARQLAADYGDLDRTLQKHWDPRLGSGTGRYQYKGMIQSRQQMIERYTTGQLGAGQWAATGRMDPTVTPGTPSLPHRMLGAMRVSGAAMPGAQRGIEGGLQATPETLQQEAAAVAKLNGGLAQAVAAKEKSLGLTRQTTEATEQAKETFRRIVAEQEKMARLSKEALAAIRKINQAEGEIAAKKQQQAAVVAKPISPAQEKAMLGGVDLEAQELEEAAGRKIVVQQLMARGATDVAEKFAKQGEETRSKAEVLRDVARSGKMTAEMEKELGLQTEKTTQKARKSNRLLTSMRNTLIRYFVIWQGLRAVKKTISGWMEAHKVMGEALAQFSWRMGVTGAAAQEYAATLRQVAIATGTGAEKLAGPLGMTADPGMLADAARATRMFGGEVQDWLRTLDKGVGVLDAHAAAMRIAAMTTEEYSKILQASSNLAEEWNMQTTEAAGLMAGLAAATGEDEQKIVALSNALSKLYSVNEALIRAGSGPAVVVGAGGARERRPLEQVMGEVARLPVEAQRQIATEIGLTTEAQQQLFLDALAGWPQVTQAITETTSATGEFDRAIAATDESLGAHVESMKQAWSGLLGIIGDTDFVKNFISDLGDMSTGFAGFIDDQKSSWGEYLDYLEKTYGYTGLEKLLRTGGPIGYGGWRRREAEGLGAEMTPEERERGRGLVAAQAAVPTGPAAWQQFRAQRLPEGVTIDRAVKEMERIITEEFVGVFETATGELIEVTQQSIDAERQLTLVLEEEGRRKPVDVYGPAWQQALQNLQEEVKEQSFNLERLRDIKPEQFDVAMQTRLPHWERRLEAVPGFEEEPEWQNFFVGQNDVGRRQLATQTAMQYTLQEILDAEKKQLEGMWNIPAGVTMRVPLQSLDLMRWMQEGGGEGAPGTGFPGGAGEVPPDLMAPVNMSATNLDGSAIQLDGAATNLTGSANSLTQAAQEFGAKIYGGVPVEPGVAKAEAAMEGGVRETGPHPMVGGIGAEASLTPPGAYYPPEVRQAANIQFETTVQLDGKTIARAIETEYVKDLRNASRGRIGGLRP